MEIRLTQAQYEAIKSGMISSKFEELDLNNDGTITNADLTLAENDKIKGQINKLLNETDKETELQKFELSEINDLIENQKKAETSGVDFSTSNVDGYQKVDLTNIDSENSSVLLAKLEIVENNVNLLTEEVERLSEELVANKEDLEEKEDIQNTKEKELIEANDDANRQDKILNKNVDDLTQINEDLVRTNKKIQSQVETDEADYQQNINSAVSRANATYDPTKHGDNYQAYVRSAVEKTSSGQSASLNRLNSEADSLASSANTAAQTVENQENTLEFAERAAATAEMNLNIANTNVKTATDNVNRNTQELAGATTALNTETENAQDLVTATDNALAAEAAASSDPLVFDADGDGVKTSTEKVNFDIDGDGELDVVNNAADWVLAFDNDNDGIVGENGTELFGDNTDFDGDGIKDGYKDGFDALKALAQREGMISAADNTLDENDLKKLEEKYGLKMTNGYGGEAKSLSELGITQINIAQTNEKTLVKNFDGQENDLMTQEGATFVVNGQTRQYADIWNKKFDSTTNADGVSELLTPEIKDLKAEKHSGLVFKIKPEKAQKSEANLDAIKSNGYDNVDLSDEILDKLIELEEE